LSCVGGGRDHGRQLSDIASATSHFKGVPFFQFLGDRQHVHRLALSVKGYDSPVDLPVHLAVEILRTEDFQYLKKSFLV
jgi:hypothetical protein